MKKLMIAAALVAMAFASQAAMTDWKLSSVGSDYKGWTAYVIPGTTAATKFESLAAIQAAAADDGGSGEITGTVTRSASGKATDSAFIAGPTTDTGSASYYYVIVNAAGDTYKIGSAVVNTGKVYDPEAQQSSPGAVSTTFANAAFGADQKFGGDVPEPTSAMLLLLGVAGLALRRRQA